MTHIVPREIIRDFIELTNILYQNPQKNIYEILGDNSFEMAKGGLDDIVINDQFIHLNGLLLDAHIPVTKWHGDASPSQKEKLIKNSAGILQITPESLESLLTNKRGACLSLFRI